MSGSVRGEKEEGYCVFPSRTMARGSTTAVCNWPDVQGWGSSLCANGPAQLAGRYTSNQRQGKERYSHCDFRWRAVMPIRVALADDHVLVRQGLRSLLERERFRIVAEASDGREMIRMVELLHPDVAVVDIRMPLLNGIDAVRELARSCIKTKMILLSQHDEAQYIHEALEAGVRGYVLKGQVASDLVQAIQQVARGQVYLSPRVSGAI